MQVLGFKLFILAVTVVGLTLSHAVDTEKPTNPSGHVYGPAIHISSGILQLAPDTEQPQLLLVPNVHSSSAGNPWPHFYVDALTASHLPHSSGLPASPIFEHEPRILVNDNVDFSQLKVKPIVQSHGR
ncbi:hypothetical protein KR009_000872 [Drosophila setifemur]|nr:hypothetical protein KR009_000872 [Drosophila setifemur]